MKNYDVAIIGGGPGGYVTAIRLNQYGINSIVFEKERLGGVCLNKGCIPTKALVKVADLYREIKKSSVFGLEIPSYSFNYQQISQRKDNVVEKLVGGVEYIFKKRKIPVIKAGVYEIEKIFDGYLVKTNDSEIKAKYIIIATGSKPKDLPFMKFDGEYILSSDDILKIQSLPKEMVIVGGGVIGCEFASVFNALGVNIQIVEYFPKLVFNEDEEISKRLAMALKKEGIKLHLKTSVTAYEIINDKVVLKLSNGKEIETEKVLMSVGREPVFNIKLTGFDIDFAGKFVKIDENMMTNAENIFAIGDITGKLMLAHSASKQGLQVADILNYRIKNISRTIKSIDYKNIPRCTFTHPEIGSVGLTEKEAKEQFENILVGKFPFTANGKALGMDETFGFVKTIADAKTKKIVGVHIIGANATELIASAAILLYSEFDYEKIGEFVFAHPTLSEAVGESIEDLEKLAIHKM